MDHMHRRFGLARRLIQNQKSQHLSNTHGIAISRDMKQRAPNKISQVQSILSLHNKQKQRQHEQQQRHIHSQQLQRSQHLRQIERSKQAQKLQQPQQFEQFQDGQAEATESRLSMLRSKNTCSGNNNGNSISLNSARNNSNMNKFGHSDWNINAKIVKRKIASLTGQQHQL